MFRDAETGEDLKFTKSKWGAAEGRVNLDYRSIILMGTGAMSVKNTSNGTGLSRSMLFDMDSNEKDINDSNEEDINFSDEGGEEENPLFRKFMRDGPLKPMAHRRWNVKTGTVDPEPNDSGFVRKRGLKKLEPDSTLTSENIDSHREKGARELSQHVLNVWQADYSDRHRESTGGGSQNTGTSSITAAGLDSTSFSAKSSPRTLKSIHPPPKLQLSSREKTKNNDNKSNFSSISETERSRQQQSQGSNLSVKSNSIGSLSSSHIHLENVLFNELYLKVSQIDEIRNPVSLIRNKPKDIQQALIAEDEERKLTLIKHCEELAYMKARNIRELRQAYIDEEKREKKRIEHVAEWPENSVTGKELRRRYEEERAQAKVYLETLQHDNEVLLIRKMKQRKLLW